MAKYEFLTLVGQTIDFINPLGRHNSVYVSSVKSAYKLFELQSAGYTFIKPEETVVGVCTACES